jgi:hypothetical protein
MARSASPALSGLGLRAGTCTSSYPFLVVLWIEEGGGRAKET